LGMASAPVVFVRFLQREDRMEIQLPSGFSQQELDVIRSLPGRRYDRERRIWIAPQGRAALKRLRAVFGPGGVKVITGAQDWPQTQTGTSAQLLRRVGEALVVRGYSPATRKVYLGHLRRFLAWCGDGVRELPENAGDQGQAYLLELIGQQGISMSYQNQVVSALRFFCEEVLGRPRLALSIPRPRKERLLPSVLSPGEVAAMLKKARNSKHRALLMLLYAAGLRVGEVVRLRPSDIDGERGLVRVRRGKGRKDRYTILAQRALEAVRIYRDAFPTDPWLFPSPRPDRHITTRTVQRIVKNAAAAAGIQKRVTAHTLRHSFATHLLEKGTNLRIIQELLGHQSARTTQIYTHVARSTIESVRSPLDDLD